MISSTVCQNLIRGKAIADKIDCGMIMLEVIRRLTVRSLIKKKKDLNSQQSKISV